jgi:ribosomal protein L37AE/L43A
MPIAHMKCKHCLYQDIYDVTTSEIILCRKCGKEIEKSRWFVLKSEED